MAQSKLYHNRQISIAKGIGITLMVVGHSECPPYLHDVIYNFHMVLFYFLSGFFFRDEKIIDGGRKYIMRKFWGLYWPYIKWSLIFILLHNFFYEIGFNESSLTNQEIWINIKRSIRGMYQGEHFLGAYWFLISLFQVILIFSTIIWFKHQLKINNFEIIVVGILFIIGILSIQTKYKISITRELMVLPFYYLGYYVGNRDFQITKTFHIMSFTVCIPLLLVLSIYISTAVGGNNYGPYCSYLLSSLCGIIITMSVSALLQNNRLGMLFDRLGTFTLAIMTFHFLGFKILSAVIAYFLELPSAVLKEWPVPLELQSYWLLYSIVGILFPVSLVLLSDRIKSSVLRTIQ